jgi:signal transduction histidine kinase/CheY-like chemotaxis protein
MLSQLKSSMSFDDGDRSDEASDAIIDALWIQAKRAPAPVIVMAVILSSISYGKINISVILGWVLLVVAALGLRFYAIKSFKKNSKAPRRPMLNKAAAMSLMSGVIHSLSLAMFPVFSESERALQTVLLLGLATGTVATSLGFRKVFVSYSVPTIGGVAFCWIMFPVSTVPLWTSYALATLVLYLGLTLFLLAEENFRRFERQIEQQSSLLKALDSAESANRAKTRFLAAASHDLRQPLHTLSLFGAALRMRNLDPKSRDIAEQLNAATEDLAFELDALLDISKLDAGVVTVEKNRFDATLAVKQIVDAYQPIAASKKLTLTLTREAEVVVETDRILFDRIIRNLVDNAVKYTDLGTVEVRVTRNLENGMCQISVLDTGRGIADDQVELIFEEFYQVSNPERDRGKGLGLGLSIVRRMAKLLDAPVTVSSSPGIGTTFNVAFPFADVATKRAEISLPMKEGQQENLDLKGLVILVLDDESSVRKGMQTLLEGLGCNVHLASNAAEAFEALRRSSIHIACVDFRIGATENGIEVLKKMQALEPSLQGLLISGDTAPDRLKEAQVAGVKLLHKPVQVSEFKKSLYFIKQALEAR